MGFDLSPFLNPKKITLLDLQGKSVAIDGMNMLYQILYNPYQMQKKLPNIFYLDRTQQVITHLYGWIQKVTHLYHAKILPIVVFDGKSDEMKQKIHVDTGRNFHHLQKLYRSAMKKGDWDSAKQIALNHNYMLISCIQESKNLLQMAGVPVIMAPSEAEAQCAALQKQGIVDYIVSHDADTILYGGTAIIKHLNFQTRKKVKGKWKTIQPTLELIEAKKVLNQMKMSRNQLIEYSILVGNDYTPGIPQMGPQTAARALHYYDNLENMRELHPNLFTKLTKHRIKNIKQIFLKPDTFNLTKIELNKFNRLGLEDLLLSKHHLNKNRIISRLDKLERKYLKFAKNLHIDNLKIEPQAPVVFDRPIQKHLARAKVKNLKSISNTTPILAFTSSIYISKDTTNSIRIQTPQKHNPQQKKNQGKPTKICLKKYFLQEKKK